MVLYWRVSSLTSLTILLRVMMDLRRVPTKYSLIWLSLPVDVRLPHNHGSRLGSFEVGEAENSNMIFVTIKPNLSCCLKASPGCCLSSLTERFAISPNKGGEHCR